MKVFITGASSGIGQGFARRYGQAGAVLGLVARRGELLESLAGELRHKGATVTVYALDVSNTSAVVGAANDFLNRAEGADLVIANAAVGTASVLAEGDAESVAKMLSINVVGVTNTIIPFVPQMLKQGSGTLAAVSSVAGYRALPGRAAYCASKAAVITFMDALRMEIAGSGVHAMTLCPGFVRTPMTATMTFRMPFLLECEDAVRLMVGAIARRETTYTLPWQMNLLRRVMVNAPEWLLRLAVPPARTESTL